MASMVATTTTTLATTTPSAGEQWEPEEVKPYFSAGDEVWVHVDSALGITPDDTTFIPRPGVVESSMDGVLYTVRGLDGESTSLLAGFEQMERDWPAFTPDESGGAGATKVKNPAPTMPSCKLLKGCTFQMPLNRLISFASAATYLLSALTTPKYPLVTFSPL